MKRPRGLFAYIPPADDRVMGWYLTLIVIVPILLVLIVQLLANEVSKEQSDEKPAASTVIAQ
jgi:hypothetical protein